MSIPLKFERRAYLWRVNARAFPDDAHKAGTKVTLDEVIDVLEAEHSAGRARIYLSPGSRPLDDSEIDKRDEKNQIYIANIRRDPANGVVEILINRGDPNAVSPAFLNAQDNSVRVERPEPAESPGWSAHLVVGTKDEGGTHRACYEQMSHVPSSTVLTALDRIIARALNGNPAYHYDAIVSVKGRKKIQSRPYRPGLEVSRVPSETLEDDIQSGSLRTITLTKRSTFYQGPGADDKVRRQQQKVVITLAPIQDKRKIKDMVASVLEQAKSESYEAVTFNVDDLPGGQTSSPTISITDEDAMEQLYVRAKRLTGFSRELEQCYADICSDITQKMVVIIHTNSNW